MRPKSIGEAHRIIIQLKSRIKDLEKENKRLNRMCKNQANLLRWSAILYGRANPIDLHAVKTTIY